MRAGRLLVVAGGTRATASTRHRLWNYRPWLEADGVELDWIEYGGGREPTRWSALKERARFASRLLRRGRGAPAVLVQKVLLPGWLLTAWRRQGARVVYDFDDALFHQALWGETAAQAARRRRRLDAVLARVDVVTAGSPPIADYARLRARRVEVVYPSLRRDRFEARPTGGRSASDGVRIGWIGNDQSQIYLAALEPVLREVLAEHPDARLVVCSSVAPELHPELTARLEFVPWSESAELDAAASFDVAVSPLGPEPWSRARGGRVSVLLSMASGVPVVASPGGGLDDLAAGSGGVRFADDREAWLAGLRELVSDAEARRRAGEAARGVIDARIWADVQYPRFRQIVLGG